jgi:hypothetical protein
MGRACSMMGEKRNAYRIVQDIGGKVRRKETTRKSKT